MYTKTLIILTTLLAIVGCHQPRNCWLHRPEGHSITVLQGPDPVREWFNANSSRPRFIGLYSPT